MSGTRALICAVLVGLGLSFAVSAIAVVGDAPVYYRSDDGLACAGCHGNAGEGGGEGGAATICVLTAIGSSAVLAAIFDAGASSSSP